MTNIPPEKPFDQSSEEHPALHAESEQQTLESTGSATAAVSQAETPKKPRRTLWLVIGGVVLAGILALAVCGILGFNALGQVGTARTEVEQVLDEFMRAMESKHYPEAYALFSARSRRQAPIADIEKLGQGNNYVLFDHYERVTVQNILISASVQTDQNLPQGTVARVSGIVQYGSEIKGTFSGILEQENGKWRIFNINIVVPPDKFKPTND